MAGNSVVMAYDPNLVRVINALTDAVRNFNTGLTSLTGLTDMVRSLNDTITGLTDVVRSLNTTVHEFKNHGPGVGNQQNHDTKLNELERPDEGNMLFNTIVIGWFTFLLLFFIALFWTKCAPIWRETERMWREERRAMHQELVKKHEATLEAERLARVACEERQNWKAELEDGLRVHLAERAEELKIEIAESEIRDAERAEKAKETKVDDHA